jgi:hypothetical protein
MPKRHEGKLLPTDGTGAAIQGGSEIVDIMNEAVDAASWTPVTVQSGKFSKIVAAKLRSGSDWKISHRSNGAQYLTVKGTLTMDLVSEEGDILFYAQTAAGADTLEVLLMD